MKYKIYNKLIENEIIIAILLFFLPLFYFLNPINIKQMSQNLFVFLFLFQLILCSVYLFFGFLIKKFFIKKQINNFYIIISLFYFTLFFYNEIKILFDAINSILFNSSRLQKIIALYFREISIFTSFFFMFLLFYLNHKLFFFKNIFKTFIIVFVFTGLLFSFVGYYTLVKSKNQDQFDVNNLNLLKFDNFTNKTITPKRNIYFILFDGMISLENAYQQNIILDKENILKLKNELKEQNIKYIPNSVSNYNYTYLSLSSIFYLNPPLSERSSKYKNNKYLYPLMFEEKNFSKLKKNDLITLPDLLSKNNYNFYYFGNRWHQCKSDKVNNINCFKEFSNNKYTILLEKFYQRTLLVSLTKKILKYDNIENSSFFFLNNLEYVTDKISKKTNNENNNFVFIHLLSPHDPYLDESCNYNDIAKLTNYTYSYSCAINNISNIAKFFNKKDPDAILVFQGDHGWVVKLNNNKNNAGYLYSENAILKGKLNKNIQDEFYYRSSIFNSIKAPDNCFIKNKAPKNNSNTIKFIINCVLDYNLSYDDNDHYIGFDPKDQNYGKVFKLQTK